MLDLSWYKLYKYFSLHFSTLKAISVVHLMFLNFNYQKKFLNFFECHQATVRVTPAVCVPHFESTARASGATGTAMWHDVAQDLNAEQQHR